MTSPTATSPSPALLAADCTSSSGRRAGFLEEMRSSPQSPTTAGEAGGGRCTGCATSLVHAERGLPPRHVKPKIEGVGT